VERLQSVGERASLLNMYQAEVGDPGYVQRDLDRYRRATGVNVQATVAKYLDPNARVILRIVPRTTKEKGK
jgi:zinc protease